MISPPQLPNGHLAKERIGVYGPPDSGKTHMFFTIAKWHHDMGSDAQFYGINTDTSWDVLYSNPEFASLPNISWKEVLYFQEYMDAAKEYRKLLRPQDWLSVDLMPSAWSAVQDEYARQLVRVGGKKVKLEDMGDLWDEKGGGDDYPIKGWDWGMPNARYRALANNYLLAGPGHRFLVYGEKKLTKESESGKTKENEEISEMFKHIGYKPDGQKDDPFRYHTFLRVQGKYEAKGRAHKVATAKERWGTRRRLGTELNNGMVRGERMEDFFMEYLVGVAGWTL